LSHSTDIEQRLRGENPEHCVVTDRLRANIGMPDTFQFNRDDAVELDELVLEAADELARLEADNASLRSRLEEVEGARDRERRRATDAEYMAVAVKPLEWEEKGRSGDYFAKTVVGRYEVGLVHTKFVTMLRAVDSVDADDFKLFDGGGLEAAKAAAEADYEKTIRSALVATPPAERSAEPEFETAPDNGTPHEVLSYLLDCAKRWVPEARIVGNARAGDIERALELTLTPPAERGTVCGYG